MPYRLRYLTQELELPPGDFVVGRGADCQLSLDDPLVSRRHAIFVVREGGVRVRDLGSRNGVSVNTQRIDGERLLVDGDRVQIGSQEMLIFWVDDVADATDDFRRATLTFGVSPFVAQSPMVDSEPTSLGQSPLPASLRIVNAIKLLGGVAEKALVLGRAEEAERILQQVLFDLRDRAKEGVAFDAQTLEAGAKLGARLAGATLKPSWVTYCFELYVSVAKPLPAAAVDELYNVVRKVKGVDPKSLRGYVAVLRAEQASFGPADKFLLQRLEGLQQLL